MKRMRHNLDMPRVTMRAESNCPKPANGRNKADLRHIEEFSHFHCTKFQFDIHVNAPIMLGTHHDSPAMNIELARDSMEQVLGDALYYVRGMGYHSESIVHIYFVTGNLTYDFVFNYSGDDALRLGDFDNSNEAIRKVVDKFSQIIQSNQEVVLDNNSKLYVFVYRDPDNEKTNWINFLGSGWGE